MNPTDLKEDDSDDGLSSAENFVQVFMVTIDVIGAHNVEKADTFGKSDPYCKIWAFSTSYTTCTIQDTLNPQWNERVEMTFFNDPKCIKFQVFDYDGKLGGKDDPIGDCQFNLTPDIYDDSYAGYSGKIPLQNCKSGELEIQLTARKLLPLEVEQRLTRLQDTVEQNTNSISNQDAEIADLESKNTTLENEINGLESDINTLNEQIPQAQNDEKQEQETGEQLDGEDKQIREDIDNVEQQYNDLETEEKDITKQLEDVKIEEDKNNTECEHLQKDIDDLIQQIENKEREKRESEAEEKENVEKEKLKKDEDEDEEKEEVGAVDASPKSDDASKSLINKDKATKIGDEKDGCGCCIIL